MNPFGEYAPDLPGNLNVLVGGSNVFARPNKTYGPVKSFVQTFNALAARCQGSFYSVDSAGNVNLWAGTIDKLYKNSSGSVLADVSKVGGYACANNEFWEFDQLGQTVIATNIADSIQSYVLGSSSVFANLLSSGAQPKARHLGVVSNFLMLGNTNDGTYGAQPDGLWWSAINDPTSFPTAGTSAAAAVQSGRVNISGNGGWIQRIVPRVGTVDAVIVQERAIHRCTYVGTPDVFVFQPMEGGRGCPAPGSIARFGGVFYYLGEDGFYANDGTQSIPIGAGRVDKTFYDNVNLSKIDRVVAVIDPINKLYIVAYPSNSSAGDPDTLLMYSWAANQWSPPTSVNIEFLCTLGSVGYTLEDLDAFGTMDTITTPLDSRLWTGNGTPSLAAFDTTHKLGYFSGANMAASLITGDGDNMGARFMTKGIRPYVSGNSATITCNLGYRETENESVTYTTPVSLNRADVSPVRINTKRPRVQLNIAADSDWTHATGFDLDLTDAGNM